MATLTDALNIATFVTVDGEWFRVTAWDEEAGILYYYDEETGDEYGSSYNELVDMDVKIHTISEVEWEK